MRIFIDSFNLIRIESNVYIDQILIEENHIQWLKNEGLNQYFVTEKPILLHKNDRILINGSVYPLEIGVVTLTKEFEQKFRYDGKLGVSYTPSQTTFTLFSPVAKEIIVVVDDQCYPMTYDMPIWNQTIHEDLEGKSYYYKIRLVDTFEDVKDPYAYASSLNHNHIINFEKVHRIDNSPIQLKHYVDAVIYEGHVRDLTMSLDVESKGMFQGLTEHSKTLRGSVLNYIKKLGMTHLQLLPIFDFEGVDDINKDQFYNWGYNPSQYFSIEGWYSKYPDDPYDRINALIDLVNNAHKLKLGITMDVVYNHVYMFKTFPYDKIVPGYFYRHNQRNKMTDASFCGNDIETRNYMVRKLIVDNLIFFAKQFQMDGFRFDLMGLLDLETMHIIEKELKKVNPYVMLYGEGWNMVTEVPFHKRSNMHNQKSFTTYAHFNDEYRNTMRGELHGLGKGFAHGNNHLNQKAMDVIIGSPHLFTSPNQSINYVECHDNYTFYDKMIQSYGQENEEFKIYQDFANHLIAISQGIPFYHAGQEFYRSKKGVENSYHAKDEINQIHWDHEIEAVSKLKAILKIRKKFRLYRQKNYSDQITIIKDHHIIMYQLENEKVILTHYIKNYFKLERLPLKSGELIFASQKVLFEKEEFIVDQPGVYIILRKK